MQLAYCSSSDPAVILTDRRIHKQKVVCTEIPIAVLLTAATEGRSWIAFVERKQQWSAVWRTEDLE